MRKHFSLSANPGFTFLLFTFILATSIISAKAQTGIEGKWEEPKNGGVILIYKEDGKYFGQLIASDDPKETEKIKAKGKILILRDFEKKSETKFCCGKIYQPKKEKLISAELMLEDKNTLKVTGKSGIMSGSQTWKRL